MIKKQQPRPVCARCDIALAKTNGISKNGFQKWHKYCADCARTEYSSKFKHKQYKKNKCERCGFIAKDKIQLDLVYRDGNKNNKAKENLMTICANCARLYKKKNRENILDITADVDITL